MRVIFCDDDSIILEQLHLYVSEYFEQLGGMIPEFACYSSGDALLNAKVRADIAFLDVEMPGFNGIYVGNKLKQQNESVIIFIVTSYIEYLDAAMRFHVFRYLSKPIDKQRLFQNLDDALELYYSANKEIAIETKNGVTTVSTNDIVYVEAYGRKIIVHTLTTDFDSTQTLQFWIDHLPVSMFFQSHRSYIINLAKVTSFDHELIYLCDGQFNAYLTRRKFTEFKKVYLQFMESKR